MTISFIGGSAAASGAVASTVRGNRAVFIGDSLTMVPTNNPASSQYPSWPSLFCALSQQQLGWFTYNAGISGETTSQMLARFATDVTSKAPGLVFILAGTNDFLFNGGTSGAPVGDYPLTESNLRAMIALSRAAGARVVIATTPPRNASQLFNHVTKVNTIVRRLATELSLPLIDFYTPLVTTSGQWLPANSSDGTHPNNVGRRIMAEIALAQAPRFTGALGPALAVANSAAATVQNNIYTTNPMMMVDTNADGVADQLTYVAGATPGTYTNSIVDDAQGRSPSGAKLQQIVVSAAGSGSAGVARGSWRRLTLGNRGGKRIALSGRVQMVAEAGALVMRLGLTFTGSSVICFPIYDWDADIVDGVFYGEIDVPSAATDTQFYVQHMSGTGTFRFGQILIQDLTTDLGV